MPALGTLTTHHFRPHVRKAPMAPYVRPGPIHHLRPQARNLPSTPPPYLGDWAHFPVRLNGRDCAAYTGTMQSSGPPWEPTPQALTDAWGRRYYHPHSIPLLWTAGAGDREITAHARHTYLSGAYPRLRIPARPDLGIAETIAEAGPETDTDHPLTIAFTLAAQATLTVFLENPNPTYGPHTTWGDILTS